MNSELKRLSDSELARQTQAGSLTAFEELVFRYERRIYAFVAHSCRNSADAAEVTQEIFLKAFRAISLYDPRRAFATWLFTIARRKCIDRHRAAPPPSAEPMPDRADADDPAAVLVRQEDRDSLWELARRVLPHSQFQALWLNYAEELNVEEIARILSRTRTHIKVMLFRARRTLGHALEASKPGFLPFNLVEGEVRTRAPLDSGPRRPAAKPWSLSAGPGEANAASRLGPVAGT